MLRPRHATLLALALLCVPAQAQRGRCGAPEPVFSAAAVPADCGYLTNSPQPEYEPTCTYEIPVVFHVIQSTSGAGFLSAATIQEQIDVLNEDFLALPGSLGAPGTNSSIRFRLATTAPDGSATTGITYSTNNSWFQDSGAYWNTLAWDTNRYMNVYTNAVPCCFGYVADFPSNGIVGQARDRIVLWWEAVGRQPTAGWPLNRGRTATHEAGHYLGLYHTFCGGCGSATDCYGTGDLICDTNREQSSTSGCPGSKSSCASADPIHNYMDYTDDPCLWEFTPEQVNRMRCTLENWRVDLSPTAVAQQTVRAGTPSNPLALLPGQTSGPSLGAVWDPVVDHTTFEPSATVDFLLLSLSSINVPAGAKGTLLCDVPFLLVLQNNAPGTPFPLAIPVVSELLGFPFCVQAASSSAPGQFRLTNALDCVFGN